MDDKTLQKLMTSVREACSPDVWSKAVELCRSHAVFGESETAAEIRIRVKAQATAVCPTVVLWPEDEDWFCDCSEGSGGCVHAAAAVIALKRARQAGQKLPGDDQPVGRIAYRLSRTPMGLAFERRVVVQDQETRLEDSLAKASSDGRLAATREDLAIEAVIGIRAGVIPPLLVSPLMSALASCPDVTLDGKPTKTGPPALPFHGLVEDAGEGFRLRIEQNPSITEIFSNAAVLCGDTLRGIGDCLLDARELEELKHGRVFGRERVSELITGTLPSMQERLPVRIATRRLPKVVSDAAPRIVVETRRDGSVLEVLPSIVYGDPAIARLDGDALTTLGDTVPLRHRDAERRLFERLDSLGLAAGRRARLATGDAIELMERIDRGAGRGISFGGDAHRAFFAAPALVPKLQVQGDSFQLSFSSGEGNSRRGQADPLAVVAAWRRGESLVPLMDGGFAPLPADWMHRFGNQIADLLAAKELSGDGPLPPLAIPDLARLCDALECPKPPSWERLRALVEGFEGLRDAELPADLRAQLRHYQRTGVNWLTFLRDAELGAMLADDMGLGKTLQALCAVRGRTLVVAPTSVLHNWSQEIRRFRPGLSQSIYHGAGRELDMASDVVLTTYAILRLDADRLAATEWDGIILDEAQAIKNPESQVAQAAFRLRGRFRVTLTGTPVENRLEELWSQMNFLNPGLLGGRSDFQERVVRPITEGTPGAAARLRERIRPFLLRRLKRDVAPELPERTEVVLRCPLSSEERQVYSAIRAATVPGVVERLREGAGILAALEALLRLRQACCHAALVPGQQADSSAKLELLLDQLDESVAAGHKALVFSQWTSLLDLTEPHLRDHGIGFVRLDGSTRDRESVVREFQGEDGPPVMLLSLKAGGTGLNLTAADQVFLLDPWWNPAVEDQAADRAHRIGQQRPVIIHRIVAESTIEEQILALQERKRAVAAAALGTGDAALSITRDDLLEMLTSEGA